LEAEDVRAALKSQLPEYMVPTAYVFLEALPLTPNGKVDRRNLPAPRLTRQEAQPVVAPRTPQEKILADLWSVLLGVEQLSVHDNFFSLGGDSVLGVQLVARAQQAGLHLTPKQLFQHQTIAALAEVVQPVTAPPQREAGGPRLTSRQQQAADRMRAEDAGIEAVYPASPMQQNMLLRGQGTPAPGLYVVHASLQLPGDLRVDRFQEAWRRVVEHHPILRTGFAWEGLDEPLQVVRRAVDVPLESHDWRHLTLEEQRERLAALLWADRRRGFDAAKAPLMRLLLIHVDESTYYFTWSNHHALLDGWSRAIVLKDVFLAYRALRANEAPPLESRRSYVDYIAWLQRQDAAASEQFWRRELSGFSGPTPLVLEPAPAPLAPAEERFDKQSLTLSAATTAALQAMGRKHQLTVNTLVQGAWVLLEHHHGAARKDVVIGVTSSGRPTDMADVESVVGLCMNTLPMRVQVDPGALLVPWLKDLQARQVDARQHEYTPLPRIQQLAGLTRDTVPFESIIVFENYPVDPALLEVGRGWVGRHPLARDNFDVAQTEFPLRVEVIPGAELQLVLSYYRSRFSAEAITRLLAEFRTLLEGMPARTEQSLGALVRTA
jgi:aryl carrier-like protein